ncbi:small ribosomal subunit protein uS5m-like [Lineus longissimus]|uniref:small ribosomal subunit protein uS5m-like n=1 Tax=Lineus longissimus TaxID=88925 RepID=UPI002B4E6F5B
MAAPLRMLAARRAVVFHAIKLDFPHCNSSLRTASSIYTVTSKQNELAVSAQQVRYNSFFNKLPGDDLWAGVMGLSNAGRKKGRGKRGGGARRKTDLNRGQIIGVGRSNMVWPGLNAPVMKGREMVKQKQLPTNPDFESDLVKFREKMQTRRKFSVPTLQRGYAGSRWPGMSIGAPDPVGDYTFEGFDTRVLEFKMVSNMTGTLGRKSRFSAFVVTGNKNGLAGYGLARSPNGQAALRKAKNKAAQRLQYIELYNGHTVFHNMYTKFFFTAIFINKKQQGYGIKSHRVLKTICDVMGIKDLHCKVEGSTKNVQNMTKAFFNALATQETHKELAERQQLHVVELRNEMDNLPVVLASPSSGKTRSIGRDEDLDFNRLYYGGKVPYIKPKPRPFYEKLRSWRNWKKKELWKSRNQAKCQIVRLAGSEV